MATRSLARASVLFRIIRLRRIGIDADLVAPLPAKHLVHRTVVDLARNVPQRHLDCAHTACLAGDTAELLDLLKQKIDIQWVLSHNAALQHHRVLIARSIAHFTQTVDALVGVDANDRAGAGARLDDDRVAHVGNLQRRRAGIQIDILDCRRLLGRGLFQAVAAEKTSAQHGHGRLKHTTAIEFPSIGI